MFNSRYAGLEIVNPWLCHLPKPNLLQQVLRPRWLFAPLDFLLIIRTTIIRCIIHLNKECECYRQKSPLNLSWYLLPQQRMLYQRPNHYYPTVAYRSRILLLHNKPRRCQCEKMLSAMLERTMWVDLNWQSTFRRVSGRWQNICCWSFIYSILHSKGYDLLLSRKFFVE